MSQICLNTSRQVATSHVHFYELMRECFCQLETESPKYVLQTAFLILILVLTLFGNTLVCTAVYMFHRLRTLTNYFIVSLAVSDLLLAMISLPFRIDQTIHNSVWCNSLTMCKTWILVDIICSSASMWNLAIISIDGYVAICKPLRYFSIMTTKVGIVLISFVWINSFTWALSALVNWTAAGEAHWGIMWPIRQQQCSKRDPVFYTVAAAFDFFLPLAVMVVMHALVLRVAWGHARAVVAQQQATGQQNNSNTLRFVKELKAAKTLAIVIGAFLVCWFPFFVLLLTDLWSTNIKKLDEDTQLGLNYAFNYVLPITNSALNPVIYAVFNKAFRSAFKSILTPCNCCKSPS